MKKNITLWQMIVGVVICAIAMISIFVPGVGLSASRAADTVADWSFEQADKMTFGLASGLLTEGEKEKQKETMASSIKKELTEAMGTDEVTYSVFRLLFNSVDDVAASVAGNKVEETKKDTEDSSGSESVNVEEKVNNGILEGAEKYYNFSRIAFALMLFLLVSVLVFVVLAWFGKVSKWLPVIFTWVYAAVNVALWIVWYAVLPSKAEKVLVSGTDTILEGMDWLMGSDALGFGQITDWLDINVASVIRKLLWGMNYPGMYIWNIAVALLVIWTILCLCIKVKVQVEVPDISFPSYSDSARNGMTYQGDIYVAQESYSAGYAGRTGVIHGIDGSMAGAEIVLNQGEQIVIGRDPSICELILTDSKVSRKHCAISFNSETGMYDIFCFSRNGLRLSDGRKIAPMQPASVQPGVRIIFAGGNEVISLD